jgi:hypothetical protein
MRRSLTLLFLFASFYCFAGRVSGVITDDKGGVLPFSSIYIKGTTKGTTANSDGKYFLDLKPGHYILVCDHVGYNRDEKKITVTDADMMLNFQLKVQELTMKEVIVQQGEDPAYEIIRQAIKKRTYYNDQVDSLSVDVYIKGLVRSKAIPKKIFGQTIERDDFGKIGLDSAGRGIVFLSESLTKVYYSKPDKIKYEVVSTRESGGGLGLSFPFFINFYENNVTVFGNNLNPRGFISPIANGALNYYRYKLEGSYFSDGKMIDHIKVIPKRKHEPLFHGYIDIVDEEWRIYSLDLATTNEYSLELIDTLKISQIHVPVTGDIWKTKDQVVYISVKKFGFGMAGNFVNVYTNYNITPHFRKKFFDRIFMKYDSGYNRRDSIYWSSVRSVPLENDEKENFIFKDSVRRAEMDSFRARYNIDSLRRKQKPMTFRGVFWSGDRHTFYNKKLFINYSIKPLIKQVEYNTVEGISINIEQTFSFQKIKKTRSVYSKLIHWNTRYGISNSHFNSWGDLVIKPLRNNFFGNRWLKLEGGKRISQFNHDDPIDPFTNAFYSLLYRKNYMKLYENWFSGIELNGQSESGIGWNIHALYENRLPVENRIDYSFFKKRSLFLPNHPFELAHIPFEKHQALVAGITLTYQPGQKYIQFPRYKIPMGSKYPHFQLEYNKGIDKIFGSDVDFDKWRFSAYDNMNFKMGGEFRYRFSVGGFINANKVEIPDMQHFNGNQTFYNFKYLNSFQMAPYYKYSNTEKFYALAHVEHHLNGLLTNKIPLFNTLKWNLVLGANTFYVNTKNYYAEGFVGIENIFKLFRIDFVSAWQAGLGNTYGVRIGFGGLLGKGFRRSDDGAQVSIEL